MVLRSKKSIFYTMLTNVSRILLALVLVLSGFVKAVDPKGTMYKLQEYADAFSIDAFSNDWLLFFAIILAAAEFLFGLFMLMGVYRRFVAFMAFLVFILFTPFTLYVAITDVVPDCGCFGDAIGMSNMASFIKNLFLLLLAVIVFLGRKRFVVNISAKNRWMVVLFSFFKFITSILAQASASRLPKANSSHCNAMLHAGISLLFTSRTHPFSRKAEYFAAPLVRHSLVRHSLVRRRIVAALIVVFSSFALNEFLFFLPRFFEKLYEFRPDFRIGHFIPGRIYIDKPSHVTSRYTKDIFFRDTA